MAIPILEGADTEANDRWIYALKLQRLGTPEALAELKRMEDHHGKIISGPGSQEEPIPEGTLEEQPPDVKWEDLP